MLERRIALLVEDIVIMLLIIMIYSTYVIKQYLNVVQHCD